MDVVDGLTDAELEARFPWIPWRAPLLVEVGRRGHVLHLCRYCAAVALPLGFDAPAARFCWSSSEHQEHLNEAHPLREETT